MEEVVSTDFRQSVDVVYVVTVAPSLCCPTVGSIMATDDNVEVYYGTDYGIVSMADIQQSASSCQVIELVHIHILHIVAHTSM